MSDPVAGLLSLILIEDNPADAELLARHLMKTGLDFAISRVETEVEMMGALDEGTPSLIISDFSLPQFSGLKALQISVEHAPDTPFIFVSGTIGEERAIEALRNGATDYVLKTNLSRLPSAIERALREASMKAAERESERLRREQEVRLYRLTRSYRMLSSTSSAILRLHNRGELLAEVCRIASRQGGYGRVVISLVDAGANCLRPRAFSGADSAAIRTVEHVSLDGIPETFGLRALNSRQAAIVNDASRECADAEQAAWVTGGWQAAAALPLIVDGTPIGTMSLYSAQPNVFDEAEQRILSELAANVCFALQYLDKDEALQYLELFDGLTGLAKRQLFCQRLASLLTEEECSRSHTMVVFDIRKLAAVNDSIGRYAGDRLLAEVAARIKSTRPNHDHAAYLGGGSFALLLLDTSAAPSDIPNVSQNVTQNVARLFIEPFDIGGQELRPSIRCGVALYPTDASTPDALLQKAEGALKAAREDNEKCTLYSSVTQRPTSRSLAMEARLAAALDNQEFVLHYQPKVSLATGRIAGLEALLRWHDKQTGLVSPALFIPLLERSGAIVEVGEWVIGQAIRDCQRWTQDGIAPIRVAVNVSPLQLRRPDFVIGVLSRSEPSASLHIDVEITESMLMQDVEVSVQKLSQLREAGVGVALDDFGTGYSSLKLLSRLPVDTIKIDRSFVQGITESASAMKLVSTVVSLAQTFEMRTVAEGVETVDQMAALRSANCDEAQGYLLSRPVPAADVPPLIARLSPADTPPEADAAVTKTRR
jgi:diguanylate cyclase (GGDEF)-like protein